MCFGCYQEYGRKRPGKAARKAVRLIAAVYAESDDGGRLHAVVDDWNLEDEHIQAALGDTAMSEAERDCARALDAMPLGQRAAALALYNDFI